MRVPLVTTPAPAGRGRPTAPAYTAADVGKLSDVSKMPWLSYNLPADECRAGSRLRNVPGSTCSGCYAMKGNYRFPNVRKSLHGRLERLLADPGRWTAAMTVVLTRRALLFRPTPGNLWPAFRWHDSGDLQGVWHLAAIASVCKGTRAVTLADGSVTAIQHWLPTREYGFVSEYLDGGGKLPRNLTVRFSAHMVDGPAPVALAKKYGLTVSTVHSGGAGQEGVYPDAAPCRASEEGGGCGPCRACWSKSVPHVSYAKH